MTIIAKLRLAFFERLRYTFPDPGPLRKSLLFMGKKPYCFCMYLFSYSANAPYESNSILTKQFPKLYTRID